MINRVFVGGYLSSAVISRKRPHQEYWFRLYIRGKKEFMGTDTCYLANVCVCSPQVLKYFPNNLERGDYIIVEGELMSKRGQDGNWHTLVNAYCIYNLAAFLEGNIGDARIRRQEQLVELYHSLLSEECGHGDDGLDIF